MYTISLYKKSPAHCKQVQKHGPTFENNSHVHRPRHENIKIYIIHRYWDYIFDSFPEISWQRVYNKNKLLL